MNKCARIYTVILIAIMFLSQVVQADAITDAVNAAVSSAKNETDQGRKNLLNEMKIYPDQLEADINRIDISISNEKIPHNNNKDDKFNDLVKVLVNESKSRNIETKNKPARRGTVQMIGPFTAAEILYTFVQNFQGIVLQLLYKDKHNSWILSGDWGPEAKDSELSATIEFIKNPAQKDEDLVVVTYSSKKEYQDITGKQPPKLSKTVIMNSVATFNLNNGKVMFNFGYKVDKYSKSFDSTTLNADGIKVD